MTFTVTYRGADGALRTEAVEAASRIDCIAQMKARGIAPMSVKEGNFAPRRDVKRGKDRPRRSGGMAGAWILLAALALLVGGGLWWWFNGTCPSAKPEVPKKVTLPKEVKPIVAPKSEVKVPAVTNTAVPKAAEATPAPMTPEERKAWEREHPAFTNRASVWNTSLPNRIFKNGIDRRIGTLFDLKPGETLLGDSKMLFREDFTKRFLKSLETPIVIEPDDPPEVAELKKAVRETKIELKERYDAGEDIREVMIKTREDMRQLGLYRRELSQELNRIAADRSLSEAEVKDFVKAANMMLAERGAAPLTMPSFAVRRFEILRSREQAAQNNKERK